MYVERGNADRKKGTVRQQRAEAKEEERRKAQQEEEEARKKAEAERENVGLASAKNNIVAEGVNDDIVVEDIVKEKVEIVDIPAEEKVNLFDVIVQAENPKLDDPNKESIVVKEVAEGVGGNNLSAKVDDDAASVSSNIQKKF